MLAENASLLLTSLPEDTYKTIAEFLSIAERADTAALCKDSPFALDEEFYKLKGASSKADFLRRINSLNNQYNRDLINKFLNDTVGRPAHLPELEYMHKVAVYRDKPGSNEMLAYALKHKIPDAHTRSGTTALMLALLLRNFVDFDRFLQAPLKPNLNHINDDYLTALTSTMYALNTSMAIEQRQTSLIAASSNDDEYRQCVEFMHILMRSDNNTNIDLQISEAKIDIDQNQYIKKHAPSFFVLAGVRSKKAAIEYLLMANAVHKLNIDSSCITYLLQNLIENSEVGLMTFGIYFIEQNLLFAPNKQDKSGNTLAMNVILRRRGDFIINYIINTNQIPIDWTLKNKDGNTALILAVINNKAQFMHDILTSNTNPELTTIRNNEGKTALSLAVERGNAAAVKFLLRANPEQVTLLECTYRTLLMLAINHRVNDGIILDILAAKPSQDLTAQDKNGETALSLAIQQQCSPEIVQAILETNNNPDLTVLTNQSGKNALLLAFESNNFAAIGLILEYDPSLNLNIRNKQDQTLFMQAATKAENGERDNARLIETMLGINANQVLNFAYRPEYSVFAWAVDENLVGIVVAALLANPEQDINVQAGYFNNTMLMNAIEQNHSRMAKVLLNANPDLALKNKDGKTALALAVDRFKPNMLIIESLLKNYRNNNQSNQRDITDSLQFAIRRDNIAVTKLLLRAIPNFNLFARENIMIKHEFLAAKADNNFKMVTVLTSDWANQFKEIF